MSARASVVEVFRTYCIDTGPLLEEHDQRAHGDTAEQCSRRDKAEIAVRAEEELTPEAGVLVLRERRL